MEIHSVCELNRAVNLYIRERFNEETFRGHGQSFIRVEQFESLEQYINLVVFVTLDVSKIHNTTLNIRFISSYVQREMLLYIHHSYQSVDEVEQNLLGFYILAYLYNKTRVHHACKYLSLHHEEVPNETKYSQVGSYRR